MEEKEAKKFRSIRHIAVTTDPRNSTVVIVSVLDDGSVWCTQGTDDWVELQGVPGTQVRERQDVG
jgi:hypothetical protein